MKIYWEYQNGILVKSRVNKFKNVVEAPSIDDVVPDGKGGVRVKTLEEKIAEEKEKKLKELKENYARAVAITDARVLQYQKRRELGILVSDDEADYQEALQFYKELTEQYRQKKAEIESLSDLEALKTYDTTIAK